MNNLQLALAVLGAVVLAAVVAHGAWTSRKSRPKQADSEAAFDRDVVLRVTARYFGGISAVDTVFVTKVAGG